MPDKRVTRSGAFLAVSAIAVSTIHLPALASDRQALSKECETAVALSAAPKRLRADASVYALVDGAYRKTVDGAGPLTCIVERNHEDSLIPQCMDRAGVDSVLPAILERSRMSVAGAGFQEITAANSSSLQSGDFEMPSRPGVSYMMSDYNFIYVPSAERVLKVPPHVMFYAPNVTNADIGGSFESMSTNIGTPFVFSEGPHGYMIVYTQYPADANDVASACEGQIGDSPPRFDPFPKG
jgi:hypothetical protein